LTKLAFGTEGGLFASRLHVPVVVCGPGSIVQAHIADEYIAREQIAACDRMMDRLVASLAA
jgi:acetylornithine deacetylase